MKRSSFIKFCGALAGAVIAPVRLFARSTKVTREKKGFKVDKEKDRFDKSISLFEGDTFHCKVATKDSDGDMYIFESSRVKKGGPPLHYHYTQDEWFYILEGEFIFKVGEQNFTVKAGDSVFGPRTVPHAFAKTNEGVARMLTVFQPAGKMEENFRAIADGKVAHLSAEERHKFRQAHGFEVIGPGLTYTKQ